MPEEKEAIEIPTRIKYNKALSVTAHGLLSYIAYGNNDVTAP